MQQVKEKLPGNGYKNRIKDNAKLGYQLQRKDYLMKTLRIAYPYGLNERNKFMNKNRDTFSTTFKIW